MRCVAPVPEADRTSRLEDVMDMHPPAAHIMMAQAEAQPEAPVEPTPIKVDVSRYIPEAATTATIILTLTPRTGQAYVYTEGSEDNGTVFKGGSSVGEIKLDGRYIYVKLYGATSFSIQYINYHVP
jgi:hypothetical protein